MFQHVAIGLSLILHEVNELSIICLLLNFDSSLIGLLEHETQLSINILSRKHCIRLQQIWDVFQLCNLRKLWINIRYFLIETFKLLCENSLISHLGNTTLSLVLTTSTWMNALWHTLSISIGHGDSLSFITLLSWLFSTLLAASHSFKASSSAASSVSTTVSGISAFGSDSFAAFQAYAFFADAHIFAVMLISIHLWNCSGLAWEWSIAVLAFTASSPCYWLAAHNVIFWTYMWWIDSIKLMFEYISLTYFDFWI